MAPECLSEVECSTASGPGHSGVPSLELSWRVAKGGCVEVAEAGNTYAASRSTGSA
jgi:hypothetical protein